MKRKSAVLLSGNISDMLAAALRSYITYIVMVGGTWLLLSLASLLFSPERAFSSMFNQQEAFIYSALAFTALLIRQRAGEHLCARMNTFAAEMLAFVIVVLLFVVIFSSYVFGFERSYTISILVFAFVRYVCVQAYFDRGIVRKGSSLYERYAGVRRINWLPALMSLVIFFEFANNRHPNLSEGLFVGIMLELIAALITAEVIRRQTKAARIPSESFGGAQNLVLDIDLAELCENAFIRSGEIHNAKESIGNMFNSSGYGFAGNTLIINLDTYIFCKDIIPALEHKNVLIHIRKNIEQYGSKAADRLEEITSEFISKGFVVFFQEAMESKSAAQQMFEDKLSGSCVFVSRNYSASLETVIHSSRGYSKKCSEHISGLFAQVYSKTSAGSELCKTVNAQIKELLCEYSLLDMFYELIQTVELCVHLTCLCALSAGVKCSGGDVEQLSLGRMVDITRRCTPNRKTDDESLKDAVRFIETLCNIKGGGKVNESRVFQTVVSLRNRYLGHGTMTYSVSEELVYYLADICAYIAAVCCELLSERFADIDLTSETVPYANVPSAVVAENQLYFYSCCFGNNKAEYINPLNGQLYQNCSRRVISTCMNRGDELKGAENA